MNAKPHLSQVQKLDRLLSDHEGAWVPLPEVLALGIAAYSRRFQDLRPIYERQGYAIENKMERGEDGITRSWYRKVRVGYPLPERSEAPNQSSVSKPRRSSGAWRPQTSIKTKSFEEWNRERSQPKPEPEFSLTP